MKVRVRYVGIGSAAILSQTPEQPSIQFQRYGQLVELDTDTYQHIIAGAHGCKLPIILDEEFTTLGHTPAELAQWAALESFNTSSAEFQSKVKAAHAIMTKNHQAASAVEPTPVEVPPPAEIDQTTTPKE